jgi:O-antigen ligase
MKNYPTFFLILVTCILLSTFSYVDYAVNGLLLVTLTLYVVYAEKRDGRVTSYSYSPLILVYLLWLLCVSFFSPVPHASSSNLVMLICLPLTYLVATNYSHYSEAWRILRYLFMLFGIVLAIWGIWQVVNHIGHGYATGPLNDRNAFAATLNLLWFPIVYLFVTSAHLMTSRLAVFTSALAVFVIGFGLFATTSRGGILAWALLLPILLWAAYQYTKSIKTIIYVLVLSFVGYVSSSYFLNSSIADRTFVLTQDPSTQARLQLWQSTLKMALDHPVLGTGWGTFAYYYPAYRLPIEKSTAGFFAHNDYLQFAAEGGVFAMLLLIAIMVGVLWKVKENFNQTETVRFESVALLLGVLALFVHAAVNFIFYFSFMSAVAGLYLARVSILTEAPRLHALPKISQIRGSVRKLIVFTGLFFLCIPYLVQIFAQLCLTGSNPGLKIVQAVSPKTSAFQVANFISSVYPANGIAQEYILRTYEYYLIESTDVLTVDAKKDMLSEALEDVDALRKRNANYANIGSREVKLIMAADDDSTYTSKAYQILNDNLKADPYDGTSMMLLAKLQFKDGKREQSLATLNAAYNKVIKRRDQLLVVVEYLRQLAYPKIYTDLDDIEKQLQLIKINAETGRADIESTDIYERLVTRLGEIQSELEKVNINKQ